MVDVTIRIASQAAARTISVSASPAEAGTVTINGEEVASVTAEEPLDSTAEERLFIFLVAIAEKKEKTIIITQI